jgi:hypothetical protein
VRHRPGARPVSGCPVAGRQLEVLLTEHGELGPDEPPVPQDGSPNTTTPNAARGSGGSQPGLLRKLVTGQVKLGHAYQRRRLGCTTRPRSAPTRSGPASASAQSKPVSRLVIESKHGLSGAPEPAFGATRAGPFDRVFWDTVRCSRTPSRSPTRARMAGALGGLWRSALAGVAARPERHIGDAHQASRSPVLAHVDVAPRPPGTPITTCLRGAESGRHRAALRQICAPRSRCRPTAGLDRPRRRGRRAGRAG